MMTRMSRTERYQIAKMTRQVSQVLKIAPERVLRRAGLPADFLKHEGKGVTAAQYFALFEALRQEAQRPDFERYLGVTFARGPFTPPVFAFSCSPNMEIGLERLSLFKPLIGPIRLKVGRAQGGLQVSFTSADPQVYMPDPMSAMECVFILECARAFTAEHIVPLGIGLPGAPEDREGLEEYFGVETGAAEHPTLLFSLEDALRPLVSENADLWEGFERDLQRQMAERDSGHAMTTRVKSALLEMLPSGQSSVDAVCDRLIVSKRSLQRHLKNEGQSFQSILDATRSELSLHYLSRGDLSVEEISYLLAYRDPNSFYRAFHGWTGMTPMEARGQQTH